jgi:ATP-dependent helicase HrpA
LLTHRTRTLLGDIERERQAFLAAGKRYPGWEADLARLLPPDMLAGTPHAWLAHVPRFLKAMKVRAERAALQPARDKDRAAMIAPWAGAKAPADQATEFRWLLEEYRVSVFAQELGTSVPVSPKRLEKLLEGG